MKEPILNEHVAKISTEINSLKSDLGRVQTPSIKKQIENEISQKEYRINLLIKKSIDKGSPHPYNHQPVSGNIRPDPLRKSNKAVQAITQKGR